MLTLDQIKNYLDREYIRKLYAMTDGIDAKEFRGGTANLEGLSVSGNVGIAGDLDVDGDTTLDTVTISEGLDYTGSLENLHGLVSGFVPLTNWLNNWGNRTEGAGSGFYNVAGDLMYVVVDAQSDAVVEQWHSVMANIGAFPELLPQLPQFINGANVTFRINGSVQSVNPEFLTILPDGTIECSIISGVGAGLDYLFSGMYNLLGAE